MAKDTFYFQHDFNARNDEKILELRACYGAEGYGIFWMIVETMAENENGGVKASLMAGLSLGYGVAIGRLSEIISTCLNVGLFVEKDGYYFSNRLLKYKEFRKSMSHFGREGSQKRWGKNREAIGGLKGGYSQSNGESNAKYSIGKYSKEKNKEKERTLGVSFADNGSEVIFKDGSRQKLTNSEKIRLKNKDIQPNEIFKRN